MNATAVVLEQPGRLALSQLALTPAGDDDVVVDVDWSGISTGTERLLWSGRMPPFPGLGYPLVPGYEAVGHISAVGALSGRRIGEAVFVPGARCFQDVRGLFGGAASRLVVPAERALGIDAALGERGVLIALAATAHHAIAAPGATLPDLIIGHGVLGRLIARLVVLEGGAPIVWETDPGRREGGVCPVVAPENDAKHDYHCICDVSGDSTLLDTLIARLAPGGEVVLAGFYDQPLAFAFPPAFMREARLRIAAQWRPQDLLAVRDRIDSGRMSLDGLITHRSDALQADAAYRTAFSDPACLKMVLDWRHLQ